MHSVFYNYAHCSFTGTWVKNSEANPNLNLRNKDNFKLPSVNVELFRRLPRYTFAKEWIEYNQIYVKIK